MKFQKKRNTTLITTVTHVEDHSFGIHKKPFLKATKSPVVSEAKQPISLITPADAALKEHPVSHKFRSSQTLKHNQINGLAKGCCCIGGKGTAEQGCILWPSRESCSRDSFWFWTLAERDGGVVRRAVDSSSGFVVFRLLVERKSEATLAVDFRADFNSYER